MLRTLLTTFVVLTLASALVLTGCQDQQAMQTHDHHQMEYGSQDYEAGGQDWYQYDGWSPRSGWRADDNMSPDNFETY